MRIPNRLDSARHHLVQHLHGNSVRSASPANTANTTNVALASIQSSWPTLAAATATAAAITAAASYAITTTMRERMGVMLESCPRRCWVLPMGLGMFQATGQKVRSMPPISLSEGSPRPPFHFCR